MKRFNAHWILLTLSILATNPHIARAEGPGTENGAPVPKDRTYIGEGPGSSNGPLRVSPDLEIIDDDQIGGARQPKRFNGPESGGGGGVDGRGGGSGTRLLRDPAPGTDGPGTGNGDKRKIRVGDLPGIGSGTGKEIDIGELDPNKAVGKDKHKEGQKDGADHGKGRSPKQNSAEISDRDIIKNGPFGGLQPPVPTDPETSGSGAR